MGQANVILTNMSYTEEKVRNLLCRMWPVRPSDMKSVKSDNRNPRRKTLPVMIRAQLHHPVMRLAWEYELGLMARAQPRQR